MPASALRRLRLPSSDGIDLAADELPGAEPALLFLHGLASNRSGDKSTSLLAWARRHRRRLVRLDFRGHGESGGDLGRLTLSALVADAQVGLAHVQRAILVGSSLGGLVAAWTAALHPDRVGGLVLLAPAFGFMARMATRPRHDGRVVIESDWVRVEIDEQVLVDARAWPERELAARIRVPTLIVHGECDAVVPATESQRVFDEIACPRKHLWLVEGGTHRLTEQAELVWPMMERLLEAPPTTR